MNHVHVEPSHPTKECPEPNLWHCYDGQTAEVEVLEFLRSLVRTIKPRLVVETGSFHGIAAGYIARGLKEAGRGRLITCEIEEEAYQIALKQSESFRDVVECRHSSSLDLKIDEPIDLLFSDSEITIRCKEIAHFWEQLHPASVIVVHDVNSGAHRYLRKAVLELDKERALSVVLLPTPRGLALCQQVDGR